MTDMTAERQNKAKKKRDRIGVILYCFYAIVLVAGFFIIGKMVCIQLFWKPDKDVARFFLPPSTKSVIEPDRGAIIGCDGKLLAMSTPMYQLYMDCTVLKSVSAARAIPTVWKGTGCQRRRLSATDWRRKSEAAPETTTG